MTFKKKLKIRLIVAIVYIVLGVALIAVSVWSKTNVELLSPYGTALLVIGLRHIKRYFAITKSEESIRKQEIKETDERHVYIMQQAKSAAFNIYMLLASVTVIVLQLFGYSETAFFVGASVIVLAVIYWISYAVIRKRS